MKVTALLIGKSDCIADALVRSPLLGDLYVISDFDNPGLRKKARDLKIYPTNDAAAVASYAQTVRPDVAIIGSEEPLAAGVVDALAAIGVPSVGPKQTLARLESSKSFTRELLSKYGIPGNPEYRVFRNEQGLSEYLRQQREYVIKPDGLTGGKGVKVFGDHFSTQSEALAYCRQLLVSNKAVIIEEKLDGEEFSFQSFYDGAHIAHTIPVQDHKRACDDDTGPNTGGMGSYSCSDHLLPFLTREHIAEAADINKRVGEALFEETGESYKGVLYGGFMLTKDGLRVVEYNARFGDPEVMNVLSLLKTDFVEICLAIIQGRLNELSIEFLRQASVCKYIVPEGYPNTMPNAVNGTIDLTDVLRSPNLNTSLRLYYGAVNEWGEQLSLTNSRSLALVGIADTLIEAEKIAEGGASAVKGPVFHRQDIGTPKLIQKRLDHMNRIWQMPSHRRTG